jgi:hypothetical protein
MDTNDQNLNFCELKADNMEGTVGAAIIVTKINTCEKNVHSQNDLTGRNHS